MWNKSMKLSRLSPLLGKGLKRKGFSVFFKRFWGRQREDILFADKSFKELWKDRK
jgi:hypothetical protein